MQCPVCESELRLAEAIPETLYGAFVYVRCTEPTCGRELVAAMPADGREEPRLLTPRVAFREERRAISERNALDRAITAAGVAATIVFGLAFAFLSIRATCRAEDVPAIFVVLATLGGTAMLVAFGFYVDTLVAARAWARRLRHVELVFVSKPKAYRV